jgi:hypothetical protein
VLWAEDLIPRPVAGLPEVYRFLGVDRSGRPLVPGRRGTETAPRFQPPWWFTAGSAWPSRPMSTATSPWAKETVRGLTQRRSRVAPELLPIPPGLAAEL